MTFRNNMAASHGAKLKFLRKQLDKCKQNLYSARRHNNLQLIQALEENIQI